MIPDTFIPVNIWVNLYDETGISKGVSLKVTNKTSFLTYAWEGDSPPPSTPDIQQGEPIENGRAVRNTDLSVGFWVMSFSPSATPGRKGRLSVQEWLE